MKLRSLLLAGLAAVCFAGPAVADDGWYVSVSGGWVNDTETHLHWLGPPSGSLTFPYQSGYVVAGALGYKWNHWRTEMELSYATHDPDVVGYSGHISSTSDMMNLIYDVPLFDRLSFSLGAGVGLGNVDEDLIDPIGGGTLKRIRGERTVFAWQGIAGLNFNVDDDVQLFADYRFRSLGINSNFGSDFVVTDPIHVNRMREQAAMFGVRWFLGSAPAPVAAPAPPPPPAPAPVVVPPVKVYVVFFDFDKSNLTDRAQEVVAEAVRAAKTNGWVKVLVTGHTDTVGSDGYNQVLSVRRAQAVKDEMVREGLEGGGIEITGKGFHDPLVPTGPGVREPQNRRAVIDFGG